MYKLFLILLLSLTAPFFFAAQEADFDSYMTKKVVFRCDEISYNSSLLLENYVMKNELDSAAMLLSYWDEKCLGNEAVFRSKILFSIQNKSYDDSVLGKDVISYILAYKVRLNAGKSENPTYYFNQNPAYYSYLPPGSSFDVFTNIWATTLMPDQPAGSVEYLWCEFYSGKTDRIITEMSKRELEKAPILAGQAKEAVNHANSKIGYNIAFVSGAWIPTGKASLLGVHPEIGLQVGGRNNKLLFDFTILARFLKSKEYYIARHKESDVYQETNEFFGMYLGFDFGYVMHSFNNHELAALAGVGVDGFDCLMTDDGRGLKGASIFSYNFNLGIGYKYFIKDSFYIGANAKCNFVDYTLRNVIDFNGFPISLQFVIGGVSLDPSKKALKKWIEY